MKKAKNKQLKKSILWGCMALLVAFLAVMPLLATPAEEAEGPQASILSGTVQTGSVEAAIRGGGNLEAADEETITLPSGVKITGFLANNGDLVTEGTPLASVDRVTLMEAIVQVQETLEYLQGEMRDVKDDSISSSIRATAGGRVKKVYAQEGETVQEVMLRDGALAILSLDGLMAVTIERDMPLTTGETVCVMFDDDREVEGRVESNLNGRIVITIHDEDYAIGETVTVTTEDGTRVGRSELYPHNAWTATGFTGTITTVHIKENDTTYSGTKLFTLTDTEYTAQLERLAKEHREYEQLLQEMIVMYENGAILAPCDGIVSGIDTESTHLLSGEEVLWEPQLLSSTQTKSRQGWSIVLLSDFTGEEPSFPDVEQAFPSHPDAEIPDSWVGICTKDESCTAALHFQDCPMAPGDEEDPPSETGYRGCVAYVLYVAEGQGILVMKATESTTVTDPNNVTVDDSLLTEQATINSTSYTDGTGIAAGDYVLLLDEGGVIKLSVTFSGEGDESGEGSMEGMEGMESSGGRGEAMGGMDGAAVQAPVFEPFPLEGSPLMTVTAQKEAVITITVDEQDIAKLRPGQMAYVTINALREKTFEGTVTAVSLSGTNNGGSSKFTAEITLPMEAAMISGMSATVSIPLYTKMDVLTIPVAALVENGTQTQVYTQLDPETGEPSAPVTVTIGLSDGETAEVLTGMNSGDLYYYSYYDTLELSTEVERANAFRR